LAPAKNPKGCMQFSVAARRKWNSSSLGVVAGF
jgi:hypothetical protein